MKYFELETPQTSGCTYSGDGYSWTCSVTVPEPPSTYSTQITDNVHNIHTDIPNMSLSRQAVDLQVLQKNSNPTFLQLVQNPDRTDVQRLTMPDTDGVNSHSCVLGQHPTSSSQIHPFQDATCIQTFEMT